MKLNVTTQFNIKYPPENHKYYNQNNARKTLTKRLLDKCKGYCMYCGKKIRVEGDEYFQLEHSVDKHGNIHQEVDKRDTLVHCKYNMAISCPECNLVCKKVVDKIDLLRFAPISKCPSKCESICEQFNSIRKEYIKKNAIILQPIGIDTVGENAINYNLFKHVFEPNEEITDKDEIFLIQNHIDRFRLNGNRFSPAVINLCVKIVSYIREGVMDVNGIFRLLNLEDPENIIGVSFISFLKQYFSSSTCKEIDKFCRMLVILDTIYS